MSALIVEHLSAWTGLTESVAWAYVWLFWLLVAVTFAPVLVRLFVPTLDIKDHLLRGLGWTIVIGSLLTAVALGRTATVAFLCLVSFLALREIFSLFPVKLSRAARAIGYALVALQYGAAWTGVLAWSSAALTLFIVVAPIVVLFTDGIEQYAARVGALVLAVLLAGFCLSHIALLSALPPERNPVGGGPGLLIFCVFLPQLGDNAQYAFGKAFGGPRIVPAISPKKTWAGFLGGVVTVTLVALPTARSLTPLSSSWALLAGVLFAILGFLGDITISALKREAKVKDAGSILPGFGGVLDRVDSLLFVAPAFVYFLFLAGYI